MGFCRSKWAAFVSTNVSLSFFFFVQDCSPEIIAGICLEDAVRGRTRDMERRKLLGIGLQCLDSSEMGGIPSRWIFG